MHRVGDILAGKYRLARSIGKGGMGEVFEAEHQELGKRFAIKIPTPELMEDQRNLERFKREPKVAAATGHKCIVDVYDIGVTHVGIPFVVMEYLDGENFGDYIAHQGQVEIDFAVYVIAQVLSGLTAAHGKGIIHRDLKPDNVVLVDSGRALPDVKLLDFGTSKIVTGTGADAHRLTQSGTILGTPYYMAPEQIRAHANLDHRLDVYAVGVMLYEALTGQVPFDSDNVYTLVHMVLHEELINPRVYRGDLPVEIERVILKAMNRDRNQRYDTAAHMLQALLPHIDELERVRIWVPEDMRVSETSGVRSSARPTAPEGLSDDEMGRIQTMEADVDSVDASLLVFEKYLALRKLSQGQTGAVYLARTEGGSSTFHRPVAIKMLHSHLTEDKAAVRAFVREAKLAHGLVHPSIVQVLDFGEHAGQYLAVLEYVHGYRFDLLTHYLAKSGQPLSVEHAVYVISKVLEGLAFAHALADSTGSPLGLVHCGINPQNVHISIDGQVKVSGFGIGRVLSETTGSGTSRSGGSFAYMAPEQVNGDAVDHRTDLFSAAIVLYETLTGQPLFGSGGDALTVMRVSKADAPDIRHVRPDLPSATSDILQKALAADPAARYQDANAFASDLRQLVGGASPVEVEPTFRAAIAQTLSDRSFRSSVGELFDLSKALDAPPIAIGAPGGGPSRDSGITEDAPLGEQKKTPFKLVAVLAVALVVVAGLAAGVAYALWNQNGGSGDSRTPVALIISQQGPDAGATPDAASATPPDPQGPADSATAPATDASAADAATTPAPTDAATQPNPPVRRPPQPLTGRIVTRHLMKRQAALLQCFRRHRAASKGAKIAAIRVVIKNDGTVESASVQPSSTNATPLGQCVSSVARSTRFPRHPEKSAGFRVPMGIDG